jgi:hypothetical protein
MEIYTMTARLFGFSNSLTALFAAVDDGVRWLMQGNELKPARPENAPRHRASGRQLAYLDDSLLRDIGLRRDEFPADGRERLKERVMLFHV